MTDSRMMFVLRYGGRATEVRGEPCEKCGKGVEAVEIRAPDGTWRITGQAAEDLWAALEDGAQRTRY